MPVDDRRTVNPYKHFGVQQFLEALHRPAQNESFAVCVHAHIVTGGIDPVDRIDVDAIGSATVLNGEPSWKPWSVSFRLAQRHFQREFLSGELTNKFQEP